jgi:hypothetical protein
MSAGEALGYRALISIRNRPGAGAIS